MKEIDPLTYSEHLLEERRFEEAESLLLAQLEQLDERLDLDLSLKKKRKLAAIYNGLAIVALEHERQFERAQKHYKRALSYEPNSPVLYFNLGVLYDEFMEMPKEAKACYEQAIQLDSNYIDAYLNLVEVCVALGQDVDLALAYSEKIAKLEPNNPRNLNNLGCLYLQYKKDPQQAIHHFENAVEFAHDPKVPLGNLADAYARTNRMEEARKTFEHAIKLDPSHALLHHNYAYLLHQHFQDYKRAILYYRQAIDLNPKGLPTYYALRDLYLFELNSPEEAVAILESALPLFPENDKLRFEIAHLYETELGNYKHAASIYGDVLFINPSHKLAHQALGYLNATAFKNPLLALEHYLTLLELDSSDLMAYVNVGHIYFYQLHQYEEALTYYQLAHQHLLSKAEQFHCTGEVYHNIAYLFEKHFHNKEEAIKYYELAVEKGNDEQAKKRLMKLYPKSYRFH